MSEQAIKGYVVRGVGKFSARTLWAEVIDRVNPIALVESRERAMEYPTIGEAIAAMLQMTGCRDVVILAVAEDGTETALPSYEQALAEIEQLRAQADATNKAWARLVRAERIHHDHTLFLSEADRDDDMKGPRTGVLDAEQALRDIGVKVDELLGAAS